MVILSLLVATLDMLAKMVMISTLSQLVKKEISKSPKEIKQLQHQNESNKMSALPIGSPGEKLDHPKLKHYVYNGDQKL